MDIFPICEFTDDWRREVHQFGKATRVVIELTQLQRPSRQSQKHMSGKSPGRYPCLTFDKVNCRNPVRPRLPALSNNAT